MVPTFFTATISPVSKSFALYTVANYKTKDSSNTVLLEGKDMDVHKHERLSKLTQIKVKEQCSYCCSKFHSMLLFMIFFLLFNDPFIYPLG